MTPDDEAHATVVKFNWQEKLKELNPDELLYLLLFVIIRLASRGD